MSEAINRLGNISNTYKPAVNRTAQGGRDGSIVDEFNEGDGFFDPSKKEPKADFAATLYDGWLKASKNLPNGSSTV